ncbi:MAG: PTS transporter subunit EIIC [Longibaculum muris]|uniref:Permease IIC component n=1 Tax=Longibaculum muris TaxID=1796628 RepID=A0A4R3Z3L7_9FIRM|nr:PTS transporter subunit EIIC [Longibaculum muris]KXU42518.1 putative PTS system, cellobiose-specific IIC component [Candidatus Stoquefichus sp. KLE1796]MBS5368481.1 PTS sugar transporter subunit IIC [Coprobacillus cateniformis]MCR1887919.1 PTS transporter subunit EIIC [Longibaculum muris]MED9812916.1 PTS transporter subunit EIIC [Longibaculum muris]TCV98514.1 PTS system cellobiose-specific IIC component [Longibaculum muris]
MQKFMDKMENVLAPLATKVGGNRILKAVSTAFNMIMPLIIIGAIFSLVSTLSIGGYQAFLQSSGIGKILALVGKFTTDLMALYVAFAAGYAYVRNEGMNNDAIPSGLLSVLAFFIMTPLTEVMINEVPTTVLSFDYLGSKGLFTALLVGLLVGFIYTFVTKKGWVIKMPDGVPPTVAKSFSALIPGFVITGIFLVINGIFNALTGATFSEWLYSVLAAPLSALSGSVITFLVLLFICQVFWFFGIHGGQVTIPFMMILFMQAGVENQAAFGTGQPMQNIVTVGFLYFLMLGGAGNTMGLALDMLLFSKSKRYKSLGKLCILPSICNINEPVIFGMPIILNPVMAIPFLLVPQITAIITYFAMNLGLVSLPRIALGATGTPLILDGWMIAGLSGIILEVILIALTAIIYYPFFRVQDHMACQEEGISE